MTLAYLVLWTLVIISAVTVAEIHQSSDGPNNSDSSSMDPVTDTWNMFPVTNNPVSGQTTPLIGQVNHADNDVSFLDGKLHPELVEVNQVDNTSDHEDGQSRSETIEDNNLDTQSNTKTAQIDESSASPVVLPETTILSRLITDFGLDISRMSHQTGAQDTVLFSPFSISTLVTLLMGGMGKESNTYLETSELLGYTNITAALRKIKDFHGFTVTNEEFIHQLYQQLLTDLSIQSDQVTFKTGNQIFLQKYDSNTTNILSSFTKMANDNYNAGVEELDFYNNPLGAANVINEWVNSTTEGKIPKLLKYPLRPETKFMAVNTVYFKAPWKLPFSTSETRVKPFDTGSGTIDIPFMTRIISVRYLPQISDTFKASIVELPYKGDRYSMYIIKPNEPASLDSVLQLENKLNANAINSLVSSLKMDQTSDIYIEIPRMRLRYRTYLKDILKSMGAFTMFSVKDADFSRLTSNNQPILDNMIHEAVMDITEEGTEAAAATSTILHRFMASLSFVLNQPSVLFIYDSQTKIPIFWARLVTPESI